MKTKSQDNNAVGNGANGSSSAQNANIEFKDEHAQAVFIAGTFNDWKPGVTPMLPFGGGKWVKKLSLPPGRYEYRLIVDGKWKCDPAATEQVPNPYGGSNSVMVVASKP